MRISIEEWEPDWAELPEPPEDWEDRWDWEAIGAALELEGVIAARAKVNQVERKGGQPGASLLNSAELKPIDTRAEIAKIAGVGHDTVAKVKKIEAAATPGGQRQELAKERQREAGKTYGRGLEEKLGVNSPQAIEREAKATEQAAAAVGVGGHYCP
jgi:hypothetical protein